MKILSLFEEYAESSEVQSNTELANPWALDCNGNPITPEHAVRRVDYTCPKCNGILRVKKRSKKQKSHRDHFFHLAKIECKGYDQHETESFIHDTAKRGISKILEACIDNSQEYQISWTCPTCGQQFTGNLLHKAKAVNVEKQFKDNTDGQTHRQPDVSLVDEYGNLRVAIEVVYKHDIEPETWEFYHTYMIVVIRLVFETVEDLNDLERKLHNPDSVNVCLNHTCKACQTMHQPRFIHLFEHENGDLALYVDVSNPFDDVRYYGLPFMEQDKQKAVTFIKNTWPNIPITLTLCESNGIHYALLSQKRDQTRVSRPIPRRYPSIYEIEARGYYGPNKYRAGKNKSGSKSSSRSKTNRGSGPKRGGWKRR